VPEGRRDALVGRALPERGCRDVPKLSNIAPFALMTPAATTTLVDPGSRTLSCRDLRKRASDANTIRETPLYYRIVVRPVYS
jgi:hypothetical protein